MAALRHVRMCFYTSFLSKCGCMHALQPEAIQLLLSASSPAQWVMGMRTCGLQRFATMPVCARVCVEKRAIRQEPRPSTPAITSTGFFLPVGWFLPLCSLYFLHTHISLQQQCLFLNLAQVLWTLWTSNNSSSISRSLALSPCLSCLLSFLKLSLKVFPG